MLTKNYVATTAIPHRRFVKPGANDGEVALATAPTDKIIGVSDAPGGAAIGQRIDVRHLGEAEVEVGGNVAAGSFITADASGKAVAAAPAAGANARTGGLLLVAGASGDFARAFITPGSMQG